MWSQEPAILQLSLVILTNCAHTLYTHTQLCAHMSAEYTVYADLSSVFMMLMKKRKGIFGSVKTFALHS